MELGISFNGPTDLQPTNKLKDRIAQVLEQANFKSLTVLFASEGGSTDQSLSLYNFIRSLPQPITMHAVGHVGSAAIPVFLAGHKRTCTPYSRFFFHAYDWGFDGRQMSNRIAEAMQRLDSDIKLAADIAARHTSIPLEQLDEMYSRAPTPTILTPEEAKAVGIVESVVELNPSGKAEGSVALWTVNW